VYVPGKPFQSSLVLREKHYLITETVNYGHNIFSDTGPRQAIIKGVNVMEGQNLTVWVFSPPFYFNTQDVVSSYTDTILSIYLPNTWSVLTLRQFWSGKEVGLGISLCRLVWTLKIKMVWWYIILLICRFFLSLKGRRTDLLDPVTRRSSYPF
jgi:hypothetical protein